MSMIKDSDILASYKAANPEGRFEIMYEHFSFFPKVITKIEKKMKYKIKADREYLRSHSKGELGVRVQTSNLSDPTADEAVANVSLEEAFMTGEAGGQLLKGLENADKYREDIRYISIMRMDYGLFVDCIEGLDEEENLLMTEYLSNKKYLKEIAVDLNMSYANVKIKLREIKQSLMDEVTECIVMNCR